MLFSHATIVKPIDKKTLQTTLPVSSLFINFWSKLLYTKNLNSEIINVGNSKRQLTEFSIYEPGFESKITASIVQFSDINGEIKLTTKYPFFYLYQFTNTNINLNTLEIAPFLGFTDGKLVNKENPKFNIQDLYEVTNLTLNATTDKYVLTSVPNSSGIQLNKSPFINLIYYSWTLRPEASRIPVFDDVSSPRDLLDSRDIFKILRTTRQVEGFNKPYRIDELNITYDKTPKLGNDINCNGYSIYGQPYNTQFITLTTPKSTLSFNIDLYKAFIITGTNDTVFIEFSFNTASSSISNNYIPITIIIKNFEGAIGFDKQVEYENGIAPRLFGKEHIINILLTISDSKYKIKVIQKSTNLGKTI